jgi:DNA-binding PadR family transcriptional regulator
MTGPLRVTAPLLDVLEVLLRAFRDGIETHGWAIMKATKRSGPTVYGVIDRLEDAGWLTGYWEDENPAPGKPRRRLYRLTPNGATESQALVAARRPETSGRHSGMARGFAPGLTVLRSLRMLFTAGAR